MYGQAKCTDRRNVRTGKMYGQAKCTDRRNVRTGRDLSLRNIINKNIKNHSTTQSNIKITFKILQINVPCLKLNLQMGTGHEQMNWTGHEQMNWTGPKQMNWTGHEQINWTGHEQNNWTGHEQNNWTGHDLSLQCNNCYTKPHFVPLSLTNSIQKQLN
jgi:hypothetical protein